ncbi:hypothetical protein VZT92_019529 [Zoarces viviparus]|uniref:Reverse transcriptase n=1 Tax=Zoarces viviparus TaxID=48416 RepID=A0AAW1ELD9_ZOAVI
MERTITSYVKKWLGVPRCLTNISLYGKGVLELPLTSLTEEYKCSKVRLQMTLRDSRDKIISNAALPLATGRKWKPSNAVQQATSTLRHKDIVGQVQQGKGGLGLTESEPTRRKATTSERRKLVVEEVRREEVARSAKAVSLVKREDPTCALCPTPATLKHIMVSCKTSLTQGRYTWRHNQVLKSLASAIDIKRCATNSLPPRVANPLKATAFVREGQKAPKHPSTKRETGQLIMARDWKMLVDIGQQLIFSPEIAATNLIPDLVLWSPSLKTVYIIELTGRTRLKRPMNVRSYAMQSLQQKQSSVAGTQKTVQWKWDAVDLWLLRPSDC